MIARCTRGLSPECLMTVRAIASVPVWTASKVRKWLSVRHSLPSEAAAVLGLYGLYEIVRGLAGGDARNAHDHAHQVIALERWLHLFLESNVQHAGHALPGLTALLGTAYLTLHLGVTAGVLLWLHQRRPAAFAFVRTTLLLASALALIAFFAYPTAPPRLAGIGIVDTVSNGYVNLDKGLVSSLYDPYAAVPSMHVGYALIIGNSLFLHGRRRPVRVLGALYAPFVLLVVVATGNHFFFDAVAGALVAGVAATAATPLTRRAAPGRIGEAPTQPESLPAYEQLAA